MKLVHDIVSGKKKDRERSGHLLWKYFHTDDNLQENEIG